MRPVGAFRWPHRLALLSVGLGCVAAVTVYGELSTGALVAVAGTGALLTGLGLARRAGEAAPGVDGPALPWLVWALAAATWEVVTLVDDRLPTLSDLADPALAHPPLRAAATVGWLAVGVWLLARPRVEDPPR
jgi:hypothetical protein